MTRATIIFQYLNLLLSKSNKLKQRIAAALWQLLHGVFSVSPHEITSEEGVFFVISAAKTSQAQEL